MREVFLAQSSETWLGRLHAADIIAERILNPGDWLRNVHVEATKSAVCQDTPGVGLVYAPRTPGFMGLSEDKLRPAPDVGADSRAVLLDAGFDGDAIDSFISAGVVRTSVR
jgi:crotonobetainyl-CoA:carnitine CoA-transferase CaiB-like acyl-CoA transferase